MNTKLRAATVGTFDGFHRGHRLVVDTLVAEAAKEKLEPIVITFSRHPLSLIAPERAPLMLGSCDDKKALIASAGATPVILPFNERLRSLTAYEWMRKLYEEYGVRLMVVGYDNTFGCDGINLSIADLQAMGEVIGIRVVEASLEAGISSSAVRRAVAEGRVDEAAAMLGRPYSLSGTVIGGNRLGRTIGFPTANIRPADDEAVPADGVYAAYVLTPNGQRWPAAVNIGLRPTIGDLKRPLIEAHLIGFTGDLYDTRITILFIRRLRGEERFPTLDALSRRLAQDIHAATHLLQNERQND